MQKCSKIRPLVPPPPQDLKTTKKKIIKGYLNCFPVYGVFHIYLGRG